MPAGLSTDWQVTSSVLMLHLYIPTQALDRAVAEMLGADPDAVDLRDQTFFVDPGLEALMRHSLLPLDWTEPSDHLAASQGVQAVLARLVAGYTDRGPQALVARGGLSPHALRQTVERIEAGLEGPLGLDELARAAGLSTFHFARMFRRSTGQTPQGFVLHRRIDRARRLLTESRLSLAEIALACGFSGQSHFTARFRAMTGLTPGQYRRA
jgi:AraC family transcriptional regulator